MESPAIVGRMDVQEIATSAGNHAFLLSGEDQHRRIVSLDLSDMQEIISTSTEVYSDLYQNPLVIDQHLYATSIFSGVTLFDISDPMALSLHSNYDQSVMEFASAGTVSAGNIQVLNVDNPEVPEFVGNFHTSSQVRAVTVLNNHLFTATQDEVLISRLPLEAVP